MRRLGLPAVLLLVWPWIAGFDLTRHKIPPEEILSGGPPKDGIPAIHEPRFVPAEAATFLAPDDRVIGVARGGVARAYPLRILDWHEIVNDAVGGESFAVTYCPLTGSGIVYDRKVGDRTLRFGVSGRLYQSNVLMYDRVTESLWSQIQEEAVTGEMTGTRLTALPSVDTTWARWRREHPDTVVLSLETGHSRPYDREPYAEYHRSPETMFPTSRVDRRLPSKEWVVGLRIGDDAIAFPRRHLDPLKSPVALRVGDKNVVLDWDAATRTALVRIEGAPAPAYTGYWFAWYAFHPGTQVWTGEAEAEAGSPPLPVAVLGHEGRWADLVGPGADGPGPAGSFFVISGRLRNDGPEPFGFVRIVYELVDDDGTAVLREYGYNHKAEDLRDEAFESGRKPLRAMGVEPVGPGETDAFRMFFFAGEVPAFTTYRVRVVARGIAAEAPADDVAESHD